MRVLIVDDHKIVRRGIRDVVENHPGWEVCGEAGDGRTAVEMALATEPDVVTMDVSLPVLSGLASAMQIRRGAPNTQILFFTLHDDEETVSAAIAAGARGYLLKSEDDRHLESALATLDAKRPYFSASVSSFFLKSVMPRRTPARLDQFTPRELEVAQLIAEGCTNKGIARKLEISVKTVESHRAAALRKAEVHSAAEFVRFAIKHKLIVA